MRAIITLHAIDEGRGPLSYPPHLLRELVRAVQQAGVPVLTLDHLLAPDTTRGLTLTFDDGIASVLTGALPILRELGVPAHVFLTTRTIGATNTWPTQPKSAARHRMLSWDQIERLAEAGLMIEAHTATHADLRELTNAQIEDDLNEAENLIYARLGRRPAYFAYPYGIHDARVRSVVAPRYLGCFTTELRFLGREEDRAALPRLDSHYLRHQWIRENLFTRHVGFYLASRRRIRQLRDR